MKQKIFIALPVWMILTAAAFFGCVSTPQKHSFMLSADRESKPGAAITGKPLMVSRFRAAPQYENKGFVYRRGELGYESDYYNEFFALPGAVISEEIRKWMVKSGMFPYVLDSTDAREPHYYLEGSITALYGDYTKGKTPLAVLETRVSFGLKDEHRSRIFFQQTYEHQTALKGDTPDQLVRGWNEALSQMLTELEAEILKAALER
jgi:cholesterol transport system auxiliary component